MKNTVLGFAGAILIAAVPATAQAQTVIDFNGFTGFGFASTVNTQGFTFSGPSFFSFYTRGPDTSPNPTSADPDGGVLVFSEQPPTAATVTRTGGGTFTLNSLLATAFDDSNPSFGSPPAPYNVNFSFTDAMGTTSQSFLIDNMRGFQTLNFNRIGLTSFSFTGPLQIDDVTLDGVISGAVPEPATWAMMVLGFGVLGFGMRRRNTLTTRTTFA